MTIEHTTDLTPDTTDTGGELAISGWQTGFTPGQVAVLRQIGIEDAAPEDLDLFFHICRRTGLDPFARQIYMIGRDTSIKVRVDLPNGNSRVEEKRVTKFTIQTGIDGYRFTGAKAARTLGVMVSHDDPQWCGKDGQWRDFWPKTSGTPVAAKYTIRVDGAPFSAICMFEEFAQYSGRGELTSMWKKMPANQLAKCAEAAAWRKAFPADFSGLLLEGTEQREVIDSDGAPIKIPTTRRGVAGVREVVGITAPEPVVVEATADTTAHGEVEEANAMSAATRKKWEKALASALGEADCTDPADLEIVIADLAGRPSPISVEYLLDDELRSAVGRLDAARKDGSLGQIVTDSLNNAAITDSEAETA